eukprot:204502_1
MAQLFLSLSALWIGITTLDAMDCTGCFSGLCHRLCGKRNKVHHKDTRMIVFNNFLQLNVQLAHVANHTQNTTMFSPPKTIPQLSDLMQLSDFSFVRSQHSFNHESMTMDRDIKWFDIDSDFIKEFNTTVKTNCYIVLVDITAYAITHWLFHLGYYLPLKHLPHARQFQKVFQFFSQFQHGAHRVDLKSLIKSFDEMRERLIDLGNQWDNMKELESINHLLGFDNASITSSSRMLKMRPRTRSIKHSKRHFWRKNWLEWEKEALYFNDHPDESQSSLQMILLRIRIEADKLRKMIMGYANDEYHSGILDMLGLMQVERAGQIFMKSFFKKTNVKLSFEIGARVFRRMMKHSDKQRKLQLGLEQMFHKNVITFLLSSMRQHAYSNEKNSALQVNITVELVRNSSGADMYQVFELYFDAERFGGWQLWQNHMQIVNLCMIDLVKSEDFLESVRFSNIQDGGGVLFLLNVLLQFAVVGGQCGYSHHERANASLDSIVCRVPLADLNEEGRNTNLENPLRIPYNKTMAYDWTKLHDWTGLEFTKIDPMFISDTDDSSLSRKTNGLTSEDLYNHNLGLELKQFLKELQGSESDGLGILPILGKLP